MGESGKSRLEQMRDALKKNRVPLPPKVQPPVPVAAAATPKAKDKEKKPKEKKPKGPAFTPPALNENGWRKNRSAKARDERAKKRGRVPLGYGVEGHWNGEKWIGQARVQYATGPLAPMIAWEATGTADGQFRLFEDFDIAFWEWYTHNATADDRANLMWGNPVEPQSANKEPADGCVQPEGA